MRNRTIQWCESKVMEILNRQAVTTYLAVSALVLENVRSIEEQYNLDIAIENLISKRMIKRTRIDGFTTYSLRAA